MLAATSCGSILRFSPCAQTHAWERGGSVRETFDFVIVGGGSAGAVIAGKANLDEGAYDFGDGKLAGIGFLQPHATGIE